MVECSLTGDAYRFVIKRGRDGNGPGPYSYWIILDCGHQQHWGRSPKGMPALGAKFICRWCFPMGSQWAEQWGTHYIDPSEFGRR